MVEFNSDGSLKLPGHMQENIAKKENKLKTQRCIKIRKDIVSSYSPKSCKLIITISEAINDSKFVGSVYQFFREKASVPTSLHKVSDKEFYIDVGTHFKRCSDCTALISRYRDYLDGNLIEENGTCTFVRKEREFAYEDYFD